MGAALAIGGGLEGAEALAPSGYDAPINPFAPSPVRLAQVDVYTAAYRVSGVTATRHARVGDILNQVTGTHMIVEQATVSEYEDPTATLGAHQVLINLEEILFVVAAEVEGGMRPTCASRSARCAHSWVCRPSA